MPRRLKTIVASFTVLGILHILLAIYFVLFRHSTAFWSLVSLSFNSSLGVAFLYVAREVVRKKNEARRHAPILVGTFVAVEFLTDPTVYWKYRFGGLYFADSVREYHFWPLPVGVLAFLLAPVLVALLLWSRRSKCLLRGIEPEKPAPQRASRIVRF